MEIKYNNIFFFYKNNVYNILSNLIVDPYTRYIVQKLLDLTHVYCYGNPIAGVPGILYFIMLIMLEKVYADKKCFKNIIMSHLDYTSTF